MSNCKTVEFLQQLASQGGEFAFIVIGLALSFNLLPRDVGQFMLIVVGLSMLAAPLVAHLGRQLGDWLERRTVEKQVTGEAEFGDLQGHVIIAGFGRVGQMVGQLLAAQGLRFVAIEQDAALLAHHRRQGVPIVFGDASRPELLGKLHLASARAVVLTMDNTAAAVHAVHAVRQVAPEVHITARARDESHALTLLEAGATQVVPETLESSLKVADSVLQVMGVAPELSGELLAQERQRCLSALREAR